MDGVRVDGLQRSIHTAEVRLLVSGLEKKGKGAVILQASNYT